VAEAKVDGVGVPDALAAEEAVVAPLLLAPGLALGSADTLAEPVRV
jgi:hypothetical protein